MEQKFLDQKGLQFLIDTNKDQFAPKKHTHVTSDIADLDDTLDSFAEKNSYAGIINFPSIGKPGNVYIDTLKNKTYRWDDNDLKYYCIGSDYNDIDLIVCGDATN